MAKSHFSRRERECKCRCGFFVDDPVLLFILERVREHFGNRPMTVNSCCRCKIWNAKKGGGKLSQHLYGTAADIKIKGVKNSDIADYCEALVGNLGGVGRYKTFTHVDVRGFKARWTG